MSDETQAYLARPLLRMEVAFANRRPARSVEERTLAFGDDERQIVQLYLPTQSRAHQRLIFYVHGGGWRGGNPRRARFIGRFFAEAGFPTAICGYRPVPDHVFPAQLDDTFAGLNAVLQQQESLGLDGRTILAGFGAGAQLAALMAFDLPQQARHCLSPQTLSGFLSLSGMLDFSVCRNERACGDIEALMGGRRGWDSADPIRHVPDRPSIPVLVLHGGEDRVSPPDAARAFVARVNENSEDGPAHLLVVPGARHHDIFKLFFERRPETEALLAWLEQRVDEPPHVAGGRQLALVGEEKREAQGER